MWGWSVLIRGEHQALFFFFNDTATTEIYTLSLHDALPISRRRARAAPDRRELRGPRVGRYRDVAAAVRPGNGSGETRSEEHTSELQSQSNLVCRLLLEKKKKSNDTSTAACTKSYMSRACLH